MDRCSEQKCPHYGKGLSRMLIKTVVDKSNMVQVTSIHGADLQRELEGLVYSGSS